MGSLIPNWMYCRYNRKTFVEMKRVVRIRDYMVLSMSMTCRRLTKEADCHSLTGN